MKKKALRILGIVLLLIVALVVALPFFLEAKIADIIKNKVNQNVNATLDFDEANLSLVKSFPDAYLDLRGVSLVNKTPFEGDTLFASKDLALEMSIKELFKSVDEPIAIKRLVLDGAQLHVQVDSLENANYDIALEEEKAKSESGDQASNNFTLDLQEYALTNAKIIYDDFSKGMHLVVSEMNHNGKGDLSLENSKLITKTDALVSLEMDSVKYLNKNKVALDAQIGINLNENKYSFLENTALVNQLPLVFDGFVKVNEDNQEVDITFKTPSADFKNFLAVIPEAYATNLDGVQTSGNFEVNGQFKGVVDDNHIPSFDISMNSKNASFKYPNLPKTVKNVFIDAEVKNETGIAEDSYLNINTLSFQIDEDKFNMNANIRELLGNTKVNLHADGIINLAKIAQAYPLSEDYGLKGVLNADITTNFDMASLERHQYENTTTSGKVSLTGFHYESEELKNPVDISKASLTFNPKTVTLNEFSGTTGQTDFSASGTINNLLGYVFNNENVEGRFNLQSNTLALDDFMVEEVDNNRKDDSNGSEVTERIKVPSFLDASIDAKANTVLYDNLNLKEVSGQLRISDETAYLENLTSSIFDGKIKMNGAVSTKEDISTFNMNMGLDAIKISESFAMLDMFKVLAPVARALEGRLNTDIKLSGKLSDDLTPDIATLSGDVLAQLLSAKIDTKNAPLLTALDGQLNFLDLENLNLKDLRTTLSFNDGKVNVKPFNLKYKDMEVRVSGNHTFDRQLQYQASMKVPAKYLGTEVNNLIAKINDDSLKELTIPVTANIGGNYSSPKVSADLTSGIKDLTAQLVEIQKQKLIDQGKDKAKDLLGDLLKKDKDSTIVDSTNSDKKGVKDVLGGLLGGKKSDSVKTDSSQQNGEVKSAAKNILGGLLGKKKKDTVN